jgi:D-glycerate 3-kinase
MTVGTARFYDDTLAWVLDGLAHAMHRPFVVGVNAPQGAGKSTLCAALVASLEARGLRACSLSIDDVYLTRSDQQRVCDAHPTNPYLAVRGYPGTHDLVLAREVLTALRGNTGDVQVPRYDKGAYGGLGERHEVALWSRVELPLDVLFFEGWMLGFEATQTIPIDDASLAQCNELLVNYETWRDALDAFLHLDMADDRFVLTWRVEAERARRAREGRGLSDDEARAYVAQFLPAYALWSPGLRAHPPSARAWRVVIGADRLPVAPNCAP